MCNMFTKGKGRILGPLTFVAFHQTCWKEGGKTWAKGKFRIDHTTTKQWFPVSNPGPSDSKAYAPNHCSYRVPFYIGAEASTGEGTHPRSCAQLMGLATGTHVWWLPPSCLADLLLFFLFCAIFFFLGLNKKLLHSYQTRRKIRRQESMWKKGMMRWD